jgi:FixJ family two-component response regulator
VASGLRENALRQAPIISIVDDDVSVREATGCLLRSLGYDALTFSSAEEFLESGQVETTSCLISDMHMPGLSGADLQDHLLSRGYRMPIIFVTACRREDLQRRVLGAGAIGYMEKPFEEEHLIGCLEAALRADV